MYCLKRRRKSWEIANVQGIDKQNLIDWTLGRVWFKILQIIVRISESTCKALDLIKLNYWSPWIEIFPFYLPNFTHWCRKPFFYKLLNLSKSFSLSLSETKSKEGKKKQRKGKESVEEKKCLHQANAERWTWWNC